MGSAPGLRPGASSATVRRHSSFATRPATGGSASPRPPPLRSALTGGLPPLHPAGGPLRGFFYPLRVARLRGLAPLRPPRLPPLRSGHPGRKTFRPGEGQRKSLALRAKFGRACGLGPPSIALRGAQERPGKIIMKTGSYQNAPSGAQSAPERPESPKRILQRRFRSQCNARVPRVFPLGGEGHLDRMNPRLHVSAQKAQSVYWMADFRCAEGERQSLAPPAAQRR